MKHSREYRPGKVVTIQCENPEETFRVASSIHEQLRGNQDYIDSEIVLHYSDAADIERGEPNRVWLYISADVKSIPDITMKLVANTEGEKENGKSEN